MTPNRPARTIRTKSSRIIVCGHGTGRPAASLILRSSSKRQYWTCVPFSSLLFGSGAVDVLHGVSIAICCFLTMRLLITWFTVWSIMFGWSYVDGQKALDDAGQGRRSSNRIRLRSSKRSSSPVQAAQRRFGFAGRADLRKPPSATIFTRRPSLNRCQHGSHISFGIPTAILPGNSVSRRIVPKAAVNSQESYNSEYALDSRCRDKKKPSCFRLC
jgi:hypothetical protein